MEHLISLPGLASCNLFLFPELKMYMKGTYFGDLHRTGRPATQDLNIILNEDLKIYRSMDKENGGIC
jgi:hypothetical protein